MKFDHESYDHQQRAFLEGADYLLLNPEEKANFHFMMHLRANLKSPDFMASYERELLQRKFADFAEHYPRFSELNPRDSLIPLVSIDVSNMEPAEFQAMINDPNQPPIVAKGLIKDTAAVREWDHESLIEHAPDLEIIAWDYSLTGDKKLGPAFKKMTLGEILRDQLDPDSRTAYYINNSSEIFSDYPQLIDDVGADRVMHLFQGHSLNSFSQIFVGNLKTWGTTWHLGNDLSCALMIQGVKRWFFMDPRLTYGLRPMLDGSNSLGTKIDVRLDMDFHAIHDPIYAYAPKFYFDLEPGDVVFFNKFWPHAVINLSPLQIMANMRMTEVDLTTMKKGGLAATLLPVYDNILNSDPEFIKFKFEVFQNLGKRAKQIRDQTYFSAYTTTSDVLKS